MAVTRIFAAGREQCFRQIEKLTNSHSLRGSESLCKLLRYLAEHSLAHPSSHVKEYQIATEVFGRSADFDPQGDSTVRVQAGRLRIKLTEYYASEGVDDPIVAELPKGSYVLQFHVRAPAVVGGHSFASRQIHGDSRTRPSPGNGWQVAVGALAVLLVLTLACLAVAVIRGKSAADSRPPVARELQIFWNRFASGPAAPWVIFSNGAFVGRPETGMRYFNPSSDSHAFVLDHYTGVGEVLAIHQLDHVFDLFNRQLRVKRGALFSLDDARNNDLIFVGSPSENLTLLDIPGTQEFIFHRMDSGPRKGDLGVVNVHPQPGEQSVFFATPPNQPTIEDYAVIGLLPGLEPERSVLILAGSSTFGTQAAVEYVCRENSLAELLHGLDVSTPGELKPFEALLRVKVTHGVPVMADIIALRKRSP